MATSPSFVRVVSQRDFVVSCVIAALLVMSGDTNRAQSPVRVDRTGWTITADSENLNPGYPASNAIDGNPTTIWHTAWSTGIAPLPHKLTIDMHRDVEIVGLAYLPRPADNAAGRIGAYEIRVSLNGANWSGPVATGTWADTATEKVATFVPVQARFVQLMAFSEAGNRGEWSSAAEVNLLAQSSTPPGPGRAVIGEWGQTIGFPLVPAAAAVLPTNKLLTWSSFTTHAFGGSGKTITATLDLVTGGVSQRTVTETGHDMFCPGTSLLADGTVFVTGGDDSLRTSAFNPSMMAWTSKANMNVGRGYQATTTLSTGGVFVLGGSWSGGVGGKDGEVWTEATGWQRRSGVTVSAILTADPGGVYRADNHGWFFSVGNGRVFHAGPSNQMNYFETAGNGSVVSAGLRGSADAMNGNAVMYDINKILAIGGAPAYQGSLGTADAYAIAINPAARTASSRRLSPMAYRRAFHNSVVLPDGTVLVVGGQRAPIPFSDADSVMEAELWNPSTERFTKMARMTVPRNYHSVALLLPDGRVFAGGGGLCGDCATNHADGELFSPPYLFASDGSLARRPVIQSAPASASHGQQLSVTTDRRVSRFVLVRLSSTTHSVNNDQRRIPLASSSSGNGRQHQIVIPSDSGVALPGVYYLFALDASGVPSIAKYVTIGAPAPSGPTNLAPLGTATQSSTAYDGVAALAIDGGTDGVYANASVTHTDGQAQPWWQLDLRSIRTLETITLWNRTDCCAERLRDVSVFVSETPFLYSGIAQTRAQSGVREYVLSGIRPQTSTVTVGRQGRYVRVQLPATTFLSLAEVQVIGR